jgi:hypothetical protein
MLTVLDPSSREPMTPEELGIALAALKTSHSMLAAGLRLGHDYSGDQCGRTIRRWLESERAIPGPTATLIRLAVWRPEIRRLLELQPMPGWNAERGAKPGPRPR